MHACMHFCIVRVNEAQIFPSFLSLSPNLHSGSAAHYADSYRRAHVGTLPRLSQPQQPRRPAAADGHQGIYIYIYVCVCLCICTFVFMCRCCKTTWRRGSGRALWKRGLFPSWLCGRHLISKHNILNPPPFTGRESTQSSLSQCNYLVQCRDACRYHQRSVFA